MTRSVRDLVASSFVHDAASYPVATPKLFAVLLHFTGVPPLKYSPNVAD